MAVASVAVAAAAAFAKANGDVAASVAEPCEPCAKASVAEPCEPCAKAPRKQRNMLNKTPMCPRTLFCSKG